MIIQHNIAAINSYRNLGINQSGLNKNLEKLSSGYKINRAADDAIPLQEETCRVRYLSCLRKSTVLLTTQTSTESSRWLLLALLVR